MVSDGLMVLDALGVGVGELAVYAAQRLKEALRHVLELRQAELAQGDEILHLHADAVAYQRVLRKIIRQWRGLGPIAAVDGRNRRQGCQLHIFLNDFTSLSLLVGRAPGAGKKSDKVSKKSGLMKIPAHAGRQRERSHSRMECALWRQLSQLPAQMPQMCKCQQLCCPQNCRREPPCRYRAVAPGRRWRHQGEVHAVALYAVKKL